MVFLDVNYHNNNNNNNNKQVFQKRAINDESSQRRPWRRRTRPNAYTSTFSVNHLCSSSRVLLHRHFSVWYFVNFIYFKVRKNNQMWQWIACDGHLSLLTIVGISFSTTVSDLVVLIDSQWSRINCVASLRWACWTLCILCFFSYCIFVVLFQVWTWWDWSLILGIYLPPVFWYCWWGHLICKNYR